MTIDEKRAFCTILAAFVQLLEALCIFNLWIFKTVVIGVLVSMIVSIVEGMAKHYERVDGRTKCHTKKDGCKGQSYRQGHSGVWLLVSTIVILLCGAIGAGSSVDSTDAICFVISLLVDIIDTVWRFLAPQVRDENSHEWPMYDSDDDD